MKLGDKIEMPPWRTTSVSEQVDHNRHTQVAVPWARAFQVAMIRLGRILGVVAMLGLAGGIAYFGGTDQPGYAFVCLGVLLVCVTVAIAGHAPFTALIEYQMAEIRRPFNDSELLELARLQAQQRAPQPSPVVRIETTVREEGRTNARTVYDDLPGSGEQWQWFAKAVLQSGDTFSERTARADGISLTRDQWQAARDIFVERGWAEWNHPRDVRQGVSLTHFGRAALHGLLMQVIPHEMEPLE